VIPVSTAEALRQVPDLGVRVQEPGARHCHWRVGGTLALMLVPETEDAALAGGDLCRAAGLKLLPWDGPGTVFRSGGSPAALVKPGACALGVERDGAWLVVGAQLPVSVLASRAARMGAGGLEHLTGAAGTAGEAFRSGALVCASVRVVRGRRVTTLPPEKVTAGQILLQLRVPVQPKAPQDVVRTGRRVIEKRQGRGPGLPGQVFADPKKGRSAAELLAEAGLCGVRLRGARFGVREPNALLNAGGATADDLAHLIKLAQDKVKRHSGGQLTPSIKFHGRSATAARRRK
jgi:UDP-N-acetylmuramate dehydrogenase